LFTKFQNPNLKCLNFYFDLGFIILIAAFAGNLNYNLTGSTIIIGSS